MCLLYPTASLFFFLPIANMLLFKNIFPFNTRESPTKLFSKNYLSPSFQYSHTNINVSSFENHKRERKKLFYMKPENVGHHQQYSQLKANNGIGIVEFFEGKNILVTGATGFLAKVLIEKMLRTTPKVNKIYILIRAKDKEAAIQRLTSEIIESELFKCLEEMHGESYKLFIENKLVPVVGNIHEPNLGMDSIIAHKITQEIDLIVDSAAITTFDERYDLALDANVNGPYQLMMFAKKCKQLKLLMHYSTAFVNGEREGLILEKPFTMGESITKEKITSISPFTNFPSLDANNERDLVSKLKNNITNDIGLEQIMKDFGVERAKLYGWQDTYSFTKAIGEMMINSMRDEIPILIIRPSGITSSYKEPFSGWIQGFRIIDPIIFFYRKGDLPGFLGDPHCFIDLVPVDLVVNATMAAIAKHGYLQNPELNVYHVTSTSMNPISLSQIFEYAYDFFKLFPFVNSKGDKFEVRKMRYFDKMSDFENYIWEVLLKQHEVLDEKELTKIQMRLIKRKVEYLKNFNKLYEPYMFYKGWFHNGNTQKLMGEMSEEEKKSFEIDVTKINWRSYFVKTHIPGVQKYVLKGKRIH